MAVPLTLGDKCHMDHHVVLDGTLQRTTPHSSDFLSLSPPLFPSPLAERDDGENGKCVFPEG